MLDAFWANAQQRAALVSVRQSPGGPLIQPATQAASNAALLLISSEVAEVCGALLALKPSEVAALAPRRGNGFADTADAKAVIAACPPLAWWHARSAAAIATHEADNAAQEAAIAANVPIALVKSLRLRGVHICIGEKDALVVPAGTDLRSVLQTELEYLRESKPQILAFLQDEAEQIKRAQAPIGIA